MLEVHFDSCSRKASEVDGGEGGRVAEEIDGRVDVQEGEEAGHLEREMVV
jgi:hypothetical protein